MKSRFPNPAYPIGSRKNCTIAALKNGRCRDEMPVIAGRLFHWQEASAGKFLGRVGNASGTLDFEADKKTVFQNILAGKYLNVGDIVEVTLTKREGIFQSEKVRRLVPTQTDWQTLRLETANWKRAAILSEQKWLLEKRSHLIQQIRSFFLDRGFLEIDAPTLVRYPGQEPHLEPFVTAYRESSGRNMPLYLQTSPEFSMKKLLAAGLEKIFYLGHSFRNEPVSNLHQPEFLMLEWYRAYADYTNLMTDCEELLRCLADFLYQERKIFFQNEILDVSLPFERLTVKNALEKIAGIEYDSVRTSEAFARTARARGYNAVEASWSWDDIFFEIFLNEIEPGLGKPIPTFLTEYPDSMGALAHRMKDQPEFVERFELYVAGIELANAFTELNDPDEQLTRFLEDQAIRKKAGKEPFPIDPEFLEALRIGMPPAAGIALGVDRLLMILLNQSSIQNVFYFPEVFGNVKNPPQSE